jgi:hypothetical protein
VTGPENVLGIELNEYAAELARVTIWIGELQWRIDHGYAFKTNPILEPLDHIECRDALIDAATATEAVWPTADCVVGNPPFLGDKRMRAELGADNVRRLRKVFDGRVPGGADLVTYWFEKSRAAIEAGTLQRAGLVATNSVRGGRNRQVLDRICASTRIFEAWSDEAWVNDGAAVRVSLVAFGHWDGAPVLNGFQVSGIAPDLTGGAPTSSGAIAVDLTQARALLENKSTSYSGIQKTGPFEIEGKIAREWLRLPNPSGKPNSDVVRPWANGLDIARRNRDMWIVDFGTDMPLMSAALYEQPFKYVTTEVKPTRVGKREARTNEMYWIFQWSRPQMRKAIAPLSRCIVTPEVAKHRCFVWLPTSVVPDKNLVVIARSDDVTFGILQSRFHELWSLRMCSWLGVGNDPRYTPTSCFETFPFPPDLAPAQTADQLLETLPDGSAIPRAAALSPSRTAAIEVARATKHLSDLRDAWLNPPAWTDRLPETVPLGMSASPFPDRIVPKHGHEDDMSKRTLTNLYNERPVWLGAAHEALDRAVAAAYGWFDYTPAMSDETILGRLLALNVARTKAGTATTTPPPLAVAA